MFTETFINGRHLYVSPNQLFGIWFTGQGNWILGQLTDLARGSVKDGWARNYEDISCPSSTKIWTEYLTGNQFVPSTTAIVECLSGEIYYNK